MTLSVNDVTIAEEAIAGEAKFHADSPAPVEDARRALAVRELLLQRARELGIDAQSAGRHGEDGDDAVIDELLAREAPTPVPTDEECLKYYQTHAEKFRSGDLIEAAHILFAVTPTAPVAAIRGQAEATLRQALAAPERFGELAVQMSNCPSAAQGGNLGQLQRGQTAPEFEKAVFTGRTTGVLPHLVNTRYGFHVVKIARRIEGRPLPFEIVKDRIAAFLAAHVRRKAAQQYLKRLAARARVTGIDLAGSDSPLVQ